MQGKIQKRVSRRHRQSIKTVVVRSRIPQKRKEQAEEILFRLGLTSTQVINVLFAQIVTYKRVPFAIALPNDSDVSVPIEHVAKFWNALDDTDYSYLNNLVSDEGASR